MKIKFILLSLVILSYRQLVNNTDGYLALLIHYLKILRDMRVNAYDACKQELFTLQASLI